MALDAAELRVAVPLIAEARHQNPLECTRLQAQFRSFVYVVGCFDSPLEVGTVVKDGLEDTGKEPRIVTDIIPEARYVLPINVTVTEDRLGADVVLADDVGVQGGEIDLTDVLVEADLGLEGKLSSVGGVKRVEVLELLRVPLIPGTRTSRSSASRV